MELTSFQRIKNCERNLRRRSRWMWALMLVLAGASVVMGVTAFATMGGYDLIYNAFYALFVLMFTLLSVGGVILSATLFRELHDKAYADSAFSQPYTSRERYLAKLLLVAKLHLLPMLVSGGVTTAAAFIFCEADSPTPNKVLQLVALYFEGALFADGCFFLFIQFCGSALTCILVPAAMTVVISILPVLALSWFYSFSGLVTTPSVFSYEILTKFGAFGLLNLGGITGSDTGMTISAKAFAVVTCTNLLVTCALLVLGLKKHSRRSGLQTGKSFTSTAFYNTFFAMCIVPIFLIFMREGMYRAIIYSLVAALVITFIRVRRRFDLHALCWMLVRMLCCCTAAAAMSFVVYITYGFGIKEVTPDTMKGKECQLEVYTDCWLPLQEGDIVLSHTWYVDLDTITQRGEEIKAANKIFEYMQEHSRSNSSHTADRFANFVIYGTDDLVPEEQSERDYRISLSLYSGESEKDYHYFTYMNTEDFRRMPAWLEEQGVPVIHVDPEDWVRIDNGSYEIEVE